MTRADWLSLLCALRDMAILLAFVAVLLTAPVWGQWMDREADQWERAVAERHLEVYRRIHDGR